MKDATAMPSASRVRAGAGASVRPVITRVLALAAMNAIFFFGLSGMLAWQAHLGAAWRKGHARLEFLRGELMPDGRGGRRVLPNADDASHQLRAAADSNALIVLPEGVHDYAEGDVVDVIPY